MVLRYWNIGTARIGRCTWFPSYIAICITVIQRKHGEGPKSLQIYWTRDLGRQNERFVPKMGWNRLCDLVGARADTTGGDCGVDGYLPGAASGA